MRIKHIVLLLSAAAAMLGALCGATSAEPGLVPGGRVLTVTTLDDSGPGSLRAALAEAGPRIVAFEVGGYVTLASDLPIANGEVTVAGETAPGPGIILRGASLRVRAADVTIRDLAIYAGSTSDPKAAENRDGLSIYGSQSRGHTIRNVTLQNVSVGWGVDENVGLQGLVDGVRIERSLFAEALRRGGHPKGAHSMNLLLASSVGRVEFYGNVFAASDQRSPRLVAGNRVTMANNFIYGWGRSSTHVDPGAVALNAGAIDVVGNVYEPTTDSRCRDPIVQIHPDVFKRTPRTEIFLADNVIRGPRSSCVAPGEGVAAGRLAAEPLQPIRGWRIKAAADVYPAILDDAGARPRARNPIDARIVAAIRDGSERIIDSEAAVSGWPNVTPVSQPLDLPIAGPGIATDDDVRKLTAWLCSRQEAVGGPGRSCR